MESVMGRPISSWSYNYETLSKISGKKVNSIQKSRPRPGGFDPDDFESVLLWCARNARPGLKEKILIHAASIPIRVETHPKSKRARNS